MYIIVNVYIYIIRTYSYSINFITSSHRIISSLVEQTSNFKANDGKTHSI